MIGGMENIGDAIITLAFFIFSVLTIIQVVRFFCDQSDRLKRIEDKLGAEPQSDEPKNESDLVTSLRIKVRKQEETIKLLREQRDAAYSGSKILS
jgi:hypothetical protein